MLYMFLNTHFLPLWEIFFLHAHEKSIGKAPLAESASSSAVQHDSFTCRSPAVAMVHLREVRKHAEATVPEWGNMGIENTDSVNNSGLPLHFRKVQEIQDCRKQWGAGTFWAFHTLSRCYRWVEPPTPPVKKNLLMSNTNKTWGNLDTPKGLQQLCMELPGVSVIWVRIPVGQNDSSSWGSKVLTTIKNNCQVRFRRTVIVIVWLFETGSHYVVQAGPRFTIFLPLPPEGWKSSMCYHNPFEFVFVLLCCGCCFVFCWFVFHLHVSNGREVGQLAPLTHFQFKNISGPQ